MQGVSFRAETRQRAVSLAVGGWVRNEPGGSVAAVFEGDRHRVESLLHWCERGPRLAGVEGVDVAWEEPRGETHFAVR